MPPSKKAKVSHPIDESGVLDAAKSGKWKQFTKLLASQTQLTFEDFNELPPGRTFGVIHQICYHGSPGPLNELLAAHPRVDLKMRTKDGKTPETVAVEEGANAAFLAGLRAAVGRQNLQDLVSAARDGEWVRFNSSVAASGLTTAELNVVPPGRIWGVVHQVAYWGNIGVLQSLVTAHPSLNLEIETNEDAAQTPEDIAQGRGHTAFRSTLQGLISSSSAAAGGGGGGAASSSSSSSSSSASSAGAAAAASAVPAASSAMKVPVSAEGKLCNICYSDEHDAGTMGVACDQVCHTFQKGV